MAKVALTEHHDMVKALPPDRADEPLRMPVLPWRSRCRRMVAYTHRPQPPHEDLAVDAVAITDDVPRRPIPSAGLDQLTSNPFRGRVSGCSKAHDLPPAVTQDQHTVEQPERDRRDHEQIHRRDAVSMITKKGPPALGRRSPPSRHVFCNGRLADLDSKLEEFSVDPRCAPQWVGDAHVPNELTNIEWHLRSATARS